MNLWQKSSILYFQLFQILQAIYLCQQHPSSLQILLQHMLKQQQNPRHNKMEAYKPYIDYILAGGVAQTAYILSKEGALCGTNLTIKQLPRYEYQLDDEKDPTKKNKIVVDQRANLLEALANQGICKNKAGIRLYNQKYYVAHFDHDAKNPKSVKTLYLKKERGGACVCCTKNFILIATFNTGIKMQNGVAQNPGEINKRVETLAKDILAKGS